MKPLEFMYILDFEYFILKWFDCKPAQVRALLAVTECVYEITEKSRGEEAEAGMLQNQPEP